mgnify:CR=1 FL=1
MEHIRYSVAACQTDLANPIDRRAMRANTDRILSMIATRTDSVLLARAALDALHALGFVIVREKDV